MEPVSSRKKTLRRRLRTARAALALEGDAEALRDIFLADVSLPAGSVVAGTMPFDHELDPRPLMRALEERGHPLALPVMSGGGDMIFRAYSFGDPLEAGERGIDQPLPSAQQLEPDVIMVPMVAFDRYGRRLGLGGGHYDRALKALREQKDVLAIGLAYDGQEVEEAPHTPFDEPMNMIVTPSTLIEPMLTTPDTHFGPKGGEETLKKR